MTDISYYNQSEESIAKFDLERRQTCLDAFNSSEECDAVLKTLDGGSYSVHKSTMSLGSPYFKALFTTRMHREKRSSFTIPGISSDVMDAIVKYVYCGSVSLNEANVIELLIGADQLNVLGMLKDCCDFLLFRMSFENCIGFRKFARNYFCFELEAAANRFLWRHFVEVTKQSEEFLEMTLNEVVEFLNCDFINVGNEEVVWEAGMRWIDYNPDERRNHVSSIMKCVRLGLLDTAYFQDQVKRHKYVEGNESCRPIVIETLKFIWDLEKIGSTAKELVTPPLAIPRIPFSILFTVGGWTAGSATSLIETYDTKADRWIQVNAVDPGGPRAYHKLAVIGHDIYVIGGFNGSEYFNNCRCFNAVTKQWRSIAPMNSKRCYVSVAVLNHLIYAMGGYDGHHRQNTAERYDYHTNQWTFISPMNAQRSDASAATLNGFIYIVGGFSGTECLSSCEYYNPATDQWTNITSMSYRRSGVSAISYHGHLWALGGFNGISRLMTCEKYNPETEEWTHIPDMFNPRSNFAVEMMDDMIFAIGGFNGVTTISDVECFDDVKNEWLEATDMNALRSALAACVVFGLPNAHEYAHQNRRALLEEKRQRLLRLTVMGRMRNGNGAVNQPMRILQAERMIEAPD